MGRPPNTSKTAVATSYQNQTTGQAVTAFDKRKNEIKTLLESNKNALAAALPRAGLTPERLIRIVVTALSRNPKLMECTNATLIGSILQSAQLGLECDGIMGHAFLIPYGNVCQFQIGYQGHIELGYRSGKIQTIMANVVRQGDIFDFAFGKDEKLHHVPKSAAGEITHSYAYFRTKEGGFAFVVLTRDQIEIGHRQKSKSPNSPAWKDNYAMMCMKSAIKELQHFMPKSAEQAKAERLDSLAEAGLQNLDISNLDEEGEIPIKEAEVVVEGESDNSVMGRIKSCKNMAELQEIVAEIGKMQIEPKDKADLLVACTEKSHEWPET